MEFSGGSVSNFEEDLHGIFWRVPFLLDEIIRRRRSLVEVAEGQIVLLTCY